MITSIIGILISIVQPEHHFEPDVEKLFEEYSDMVYRIAYVRMSHPADAEDVFQEVFMRLVKHHKKLRSSEHAKAWLIRCTINRCNSFYQSAWQRRTVGLEECTIPYDPGYEHIELLDAVRALSPDHRDAIHLYYYEGYSCKEIADLLETSESTIKSRLRRARIELKSVWSEEDDPIGE